MVENKYIDVQNFRWTTTIAEKQVANLYKNGKKTCAGVPFEPIYRR
jgi:hypothetical protein